MSKTNERQNVAFILKWIHSLSLDSDITILTWNENSANPILTELLRRISFKRTTVIQIKSYQRRKIHLDTLLAAHRYKLPSAIVALIPASELVPALESLQGVQSIHDYKNVLFFPVNLPNYEGTTFLQYSDTFENLYWTSLHQTLRKENVYALKCRCFYCNHGFPSVISVGYYADKNLSQFVRIRQSFDGQFHGKKMNVSYFRILQHIRVYVNEKTGKETFKGYNWDVLEVLASKYNFTATLVAPTDASSWGKLVNGTYTGYFGMVQRRQVEFAIIPTVQKAYKNPLVTFTYPISMNIFKILSSHPRQRPYWEAIISPFSLELWVGVALSIIFTALIFYGAFSIDRMFQEAGDAHHNLYCFTVVRMVCLQSVPQEHISPRHFFRISFGVFWLYFLLIGLSYQGALITFLVTPRYEDPIQNMDDLKNSDAQFVVFKEHILLTDFKNNKLFQERKFITDFSPDLKFIQLIADEPGKYVTSDNYEMLQAVIFQKFANYKGESGYHLGKDTLIIYLDAWPLIKNAPFETAFSRTIMALQESGLISKWKKDNFDISKHEQKWAMRNSLTLRWEAMMVRKLDILTERKAYLRAHPKEKVYQRPPNDQVVLSLTHLHGAFYVLLMGTVLSLIVYAGEIFLHRSA